MKILFVDDDISRFNMMVKLHPDWKVTYVDNCTDAINILGMIKFDAIMLDYDDGPFNTFMSVAQWIKNNNCNVIIIIHSTNPFGAADMAKLLAPLPQQPIILPFAWSTQLHCLFSRNTNE